VEAIAGVGAAAVALVLHLLHIADQSVLLAIVLVILALILVRDLRREARDERETELLEETARLVSEVRVAVAPPDAVPIGPERLRVESARFSREARGEMVWFNVCLSMFAPQPLFDVLLRPAVENPEVTLIRFVLDERERERWAESVVPKLEQCDGRAKVGAPAWSAIDEPVSCILAEHALGGQEGLLSFWGEPFMARAAGRDVPRYIFHVQRHSELVGRLRELERSYRLAGR